MIVKVDTHIPRRRRPRTSDIQVVQAIKDLTADGARVNEYQVWKYCSKNMFGTWTIGRVQKAVIRLAMRRKIETESVVEGGRACRVMKLV